METYDRIVLAVKEYGEQHNGRRPSITEIGQIVWIESTSHVRYHLTKAVERGDLVLEGWRGQSRRWAYRHNKVTE